MPHADVLLRIALDLTASLAAPDRYARLLDAVREIVPCDAASLMRLESDELIPLAAHGLVPEALGKRYARRDHPRLDAILRSNGPMRFPADSPLPDPFDGLLEADPTARGRVHACLGCPLLEAGEVVGVLAADAMAPDAFAALDMQLLATLGALAGAVLRTTRLIEQLEHTAEHRGRVARDLVRAATERTGAQLLGTSPAMVRLREEIDVVARSHLTVLVLGETGVGKELVARALHRGSPRRDEPLIYVNCAALPEHLAESELFGHLRGAFTGADADRAGKFEVADRGTLLLDEVGELPLSIQPKLLRALQDGEIQRVGADRSHCVDVRVIAATNRDLGREIEAGRFRADLFHRLAAYPLRVPPLRERLADVPLLSGYFAEAARRRLGLGSVRFTERARRELGRAAWPGNVRELENLVGRAVLRAGAAAEPTEPVIVGAEHLGIGGGEPAEPTARGPRREPEPLGTRSLREATEQFQRDAIARAVAAAEGNWAAAARSLGMHRSNLHHLARRLGLRPRPPAGSNDR